MSTTILIEVGARHEAIVRRALALAEEMEQLALTAPDGTVFDACEGAVIEKGRELFLAGRSPAIALFNGPYYFAEQLGCRKIIDNTFMIAAMINGNPEPDDVRKYFRALRRAQRDIDLRPDLYTHYYRNEFPERFHPEMDTRRWGPGERIVFEPYSKEMFARSFDWIAKHAIFEPGGMGSGNYEQAVISLAAE